MTDRANASLVERLAKLWLGWFCVYMATGAFAMMQQRTGFSLTQWTTFNGFGYNSFF